MIGTRLSTSNLILVANKKTQCVGVKFSPEKAHWKCVDSTSAQPTALLALKINK